MCTTCGLRKGASGPLICSRYIKKIERPQKFFQGGQRRHFAYLFQVADDAMQTANGHSQNALPFKHHKEIAPCFGKGHKTALLKQQ